MYQFRGGARNFPTEGLELPTGGLKRRKNGVSVSYFTKFVPTRTKTSPDGGLDASCFEKLVSILRVLAVSESECFSGAESECCSGDIVVLMVYLPCAIGQLLKP